ncbi:MAG: winged helix-turn-helix transcriptional regulator [Thermofilaceae archaeon]|nr:winged helix-turn-helix transcriptional regulator [Thermofilum sp.]MCC6059222.1 winged helix-turn-helix transcriptional regulator [Thermofilum sp.]
MELHERLRAEVERKVDHVIAGVAETLEKVLSEGGMKPEDLKGVVEALEPSFRLLSKRWALLILYVLLMLGKASFTDIVRLTGLSKPIVSTRLKELERAGLVARTVIERPLSTVYTLTGRGRDLALLSIPLLYYLAYRK